jgi:non-specific serine/threonine protein kinase
MAAVINLPLQLTSFIGRERDIVELKRLLGSARLVTLTGPGGAGKTRLALEVAVQVHDQYAGGAWFVDLAALADPSLVPQAIATTLGVREEGARSTLDALIDFLRPQHLLLLFDNCEHIVDACASVASSLLRACPDIVVLATSRQSLRVAGEVCWPLAPLAVPDALPETEKPSDVGSIASCEAVRLFMERARLANHEFTITEQNAIVIAQVCRHLDGLPLAIELAAARVNALPVEAIAARLESDSHLLKSATDALPPRQQTLQATIDWSYDLLAEDEQAMLRALSVFAGAFPLQAVQAVCNPGPEADEIELLDLLERLVDRSLVLAEPRDGESYFRLLHIIRQYALAKLEACEELDEVKQRHLNWYLHLAEQLTTQFISSNDPAVLDRMEADLPNYREALAWATQSTSRVHEEVALQLVFALRLVWYGRCYYNEGRDQLLRALARAGSGRRTALRASALNTLGFIARIQGNFASARSLLEESRSIFAELGDRSGEARAMVNLGFVACGLEDVGRAQMCFAEALAISEDLSDPLRVASIVNGMGEVARLQGKYGEARPLYERALETYRAHEWATELPFVLINLGHVAHHEGDNEAAKSYFHESLALALQYGFRLPIAWCLVGMGGVAARQSQYGRAARLYGAAQAISSTIAAALNPADRAQYQHYMSIARAHISEVSWERAWALGQAMDLKQAVAFSVVENSSADHVTARHTPVAPAPTELSRREAEVLRLLREGLSNAQIAERLFLTTNTVRAHLYSIYNKLGVSNRVAAIRLTGEQ